MVTARLENWYLDITGWNIIWGEIYEDVHRRWPDGTKIHTSSIPDFHYSQSYSEGDKVVTLNSTYLLGKPYENS